MATIDSLLEDIGDCGLFQILAVIIVHGAVICSAWSKMFMAYGNYDPGWTCNGSDYLENRALSLRDEIFWEAQAIGNMTPDFSCDVYTNCDRVIYSNDSSTVVTEWDLACDKSWITSLMISVQSGGYIIGTFAAGYLNDILGRKPTHILVLALHVVLNILSAFSRNWPIFTIYRFCLGLTAGSIDVTSMVYPMEFITSKWRALVSILPFTSFGNVLFALAAWLLRDWRSLHLATAVVTSVFLVFFLWFPESIRWLTIKGQIEKSIHVVYKVAKLNAETPHNVTVTIHSIGEERSKRGEIKTKKTVLDLYRHGLKKRTNIITFSWFTSIVCYTIVMFNIKSLSGNYNLNLVLFNFAPVFIFLFVTLMANKIGRKWTIIILLSLDCISIIGVMLVYFFSDDDTNGQIMTILTLVFFVFNNAEMSVVMLYCVELYPTDFRSLGFSYASCVAYIGGMLAPFLISYDQCTIWISHAVMAILTLSNWPFIFLLPETKGKHLEEYVTLLDESPIADYTEKDSDDSFMPQH